MSSVGIVSVKEIQGREGTSNDSFRRTYVRVFRVVVADIKYGPQIVLRAVDPNTGVAIPNIWDLYVGFNGGDSDTAALCDSIKVRETDEPTIYEVTCNFDTDINEQSQQNENPLYEPPEIVWDGEDYQQALDTDVNGAGILNSAYDQYDPPLEVEQSRSALTITRNEAWFDESQARLYRNKLNSTPFQGYAAGLCKCKRISSQRQWRNGHVFWRTTYHFVFREEGWAAKPLDAGYREYLGAGVYANITVGGQAVSQPVPLDGNGHKLTPGSNPVYRTFTAYNSVDFGPLNLPVATAPGNPIS